MKKAEETEHFVYMVECADGTIYTGWTTDLERRMQSHSNGTGAKYTKGRGPVRLLYSEAFPTKGEALRREMQIKKLKREKKLELIGKFCGQQVSAGDWSL